MRALTALLPALAVVFAATWITPTGTPTQRTGRSIVGGGSDFTVIGGTPTHHTEDGIAAVLYLALDGVTIEPNCPDGEPIDAVAQCYEALDAPVEIPPYLPDDEAGRAAFVQRVQERFAAVDIAVTDERPRPYVPYILAAIGGDGSWYSNDICGLAPTTCGGVLRNAISFVFPDNPDCNDPASTAAHETGHVLGLEHVDHIPDIMNQFGGYPRDVTDDCHPLVGSYGCAESHEQHCGEGGQNTYRELLAAVGPRFQDAAAPEITLDPPNDSIFTTEDSFVVRGSIVEDGTLVGARWTWIEGLPPEDYPDGFEKCTNRACANEFTAAEMSDNDWTFVKLVRPPPGTYSFTLEAVDARGNRTWENTRVTVVQAADLDVGGESSSSDGGESSGGDGLATSWEMDETSGGDGIPADFTGPLDHDYGCSCRGGSPPPARLAALVLLACFARRRRR